MLSKIGRRIAGYLRMKHAVIALVALQLMGAGQESVPSPLAIVPGKRVGNYVVGKSMLRDVLGEDSAEARERLAAQGLHFEFEQGKELKAVTVTSDGFRTSQGLKVGSTVGEVVQAMGQPARDQLAGEKVKLEALVYPGVIFFPKDGRVAAIRVGAVGR